MADLGLFLLVFFSHIGMIISHMAFHLSPGPEGLQGLEDWGVGRGEGLGNRPSLST